MRRRIIAGVALVLILGAYILYSTKSDPLYQGKRALEQGNYHQAIEYLEEALARSQDDEEVFVLYLQALAGAGRWDAFLQLAEGIEDFIGFEPALELADYYIQHGLIDQGWYLYRQFADFLPRERVDRFMEMAFVQEGIGARDLSKFPEHPLGLIHTQLGLDDFSLVGILEDVDLSSNSPGVKVLFEEYLLQVAADLAQELGSRDVEDILAMELPETVWDALLWLKWSDARWLPALEELYPNTSLVEWGQMIQTGFEGPWELKMVTDYPGVELESASWSWDNQHFAGLNTPRDTLLIADIDGDMRLVDHFIPRLNGVTTLNHHWSPTGDSLATSRGVYDLLAGFRYIDLNYNFNWVYIIGWDEEMLVYYPFNQSRGYQFGALSAYDRVGRAYGVLNPSRYKRENKVFVAGKLMDWDYWLWTANIVRGSFASLEFSYFEQGQWSNCGGYVAVEMPQGLRLLDFKEQRWTSIPQRDKFLGWWQGTMLFSKATDLGYFHYSLSPQGDILPLYLGEYELLSPSPGGNYILSNAKGSLSLFEIE